MTTQTGHYGLAKETYPSITITSKYVSIDYGTETKTLHPQDLDVVVPTYDGTVTVSVEELVQLYRSIHNMI